MIYLPYADYTSTAACLAPEDLLEHAEHSVKLLKALCQGKAPADPLTYMWQGYEWSLFKCASAAYQRLGNERPLLEVCKLLSPRIFSLNLAAPPWLYTKVHVSHRNLLLQLRQPHYQQFDWASVTNEPLFWPKLQP